MTFKGLTDPKLETEKFRIVVRDFGDGITETLVQRFCPTVKTYAERLLGKVKSELFDSINPKQSTSLDPETLTERAVRRAKQKVRWLVKAGKFDRLCTLTWRKNEQDMIEVKRCFDLFRRRLSKVSTFKYVAVVEKQERGAYHIHFAAAGRQNVNLMRAVWYDIVGKAQGNVDVSKGRKGRANRSLLANYLTKYMVKAWDDLSFGKKRYWASKNIGTYDRTSWFLDHTHTWDDVLWQVRYKLFILNADMSQLSTWMRAYTDQDTLLMTTG